MGIVLPKQGLLIFAARAIHRRVAIAIQQVTRRTARLFAGYRVIYDPDFAVYRRTDEYLVELCRVVDRIEMKELAGNSLHRDGGKIHIDFSRVGGNITIATEIRVTILDEMITRIPLPDDAGAAADEIRFYLDDAFAVQRATFSYGPGPTQRRSLGIGHLIEDYSENISIRHGRDVVVQAITTQLAIVKTPQHITIPVDQFDDTVGAQRKSLQLLPVVVRRGAQQLAVVQQVGSSAVRGLQIIMPAVHDAPLGVAQENTFLYLYAIGGVTAEIKTVARVGTFVLAGQYGAVDRIVITIAHLAAP